MKVLHICNDYCGSKVHANLYKHLDDLGIDQTVFAYYRGDKRNGKNQFESEHTSFIYKGILKPYHRLLFHLKVNRVYKELSKSIEPKEYNLAHAVTLFSDGAVAYKLYKDFGIPYVVSVRNTDINSFLGIAPHTWPTGLKVLSQASKIVFISKALMEKFCRHAIIKNILPEIQSKFIIQPNGIDDFWIDNIQTKKKNRSHNIIYVGKFDINKNTIKLIQAVLALSKQYPDIHLHLVGGDGWREKNILRLVKENPTILTYHGKIFDKERLLTLYRQCSIFAMPSIHETFGLVYLEALSQNLAVVYTKGQGVDGLLDERVGEKVNALSKDSICNAIKKIIEKRDDYLAHEVIDFEKFRWSSIARKYARLYQDIIH